MISPIYAFFESKPNNPDTIILKNEYYPNGLTQQDIYNYYISKKNEILKETKNRDLIIFFAASTNNIIIKRKQNKNEYIQLTKQNYEDIISGRTLSFHSTMNQKESFGIIDLDYHDFTEVKKATKEIYDFLYKLNNNINIRFTGKTGFHIIYNFNKLLDINVIKNQLYHILLPLSDKYTIAPKRTQEKVNIDLSSNKINGGFITLNSLSILGLKCIEISKKEIDNFDPIRSKI